MNELINLSHALLCRLLSGRGSLTLFL